MGRLPVLRTDPTMTAAGYHSPESSVGSQSWSRDISHGEAPLQVDSEAIVCGARGKVKGVCLTYPLWKYGAGNRVSTRKCALWAVLHTLVFSCYRVLVFVFCDELLHLRYFRIAETLVPQRLSRPVDPWLRTRRPGVRIPHGVPKSS